MAYRLLHEMAQANSRNVFVGSALCGVLFHLSIQTVEFEKFMFHFLAALPVMAVVMSTLFSAFGDLTWVQAFVKSVIIETVFNLSCLLSIGIYRLLFHRCGRFPGPLGAKLSHFWSSYTSSKNFQYHKELDQMHAKYGDFVRTGMTTGLPPPGRCIEMLYTCELTSRLQGHAKSQSIALPPSMQYTARHRSC